MSQQQDMNRPGSPLSSPQVTPPHPGSGLVPGRSDPPGPRITGQPLSKWTWLGPLIYGAVEVTGRVINPSNSGFDLIVDSPLQFFFASISSIDPMNQPFILHCETYPITGPDPKGVGSNIYMPWALPDVVDVPTDPLIGKVWDLSTSPPSTVTLQAGHHVRVRGQLRIENGHPIKNGTGQPYGGTGWGFMELHPYDWRNVRLMQDPPAGHVPVVMVMVTAPLYSYVQDGGLTATSARVWLEAPPAPALFFNQIPAGPVKLSPAPAAGSLQLRESVIRNDTGQGLDAVRRITGGNDPTVVLGASAPATLNYGGIACADVNVQKGLILEYHVSPKPITGGYLRHSILAADGVTWQPVGDVNGQVGDPGWVDEICSITPGSDGVGYPLLTDTGRMVYLDRFNDGRWYPFPNIAALGIVEFDIAYPGWIEKFAGTSPLTNLELYLLATADGHLWQVGRDVTQGSWGPPFETTTELSVPGRVVTMDGTCSDLWTMQFVFVTDTGRVWHTIGTLQNANSWWTIPGSVPWQKAGDATAAFGGNIHVVSAAAVSAELGVAQFLLVAEDGHMWLTIRAADGSWQQLSDPHSDATAGMNGPSNVVYVSGASASPGLADYFMVTADGRVWHAVYQSASQTWTQAIDASNAMGLTVPVCRVAAAPTPAVPGEVQCLMVTTQQ